MVAEQNKETANTEKMEETESEIEVLDEEKDEEEQLLDSDESIMESLKEEIERLKQEKEDMYQKLLRNQAEFENFKKRSQKEKEKERKYKSQDLVNELLPALDNFERALSQEVTEANKSFVEGITMVYNQLKDALKSQGVEEIEATGKPFDPNLHHAVMQIEDSELDSNSVTEELQKGYMLKDRVIRPAMVKVNK
ncbi:nucleotide exchange factor GrpE [Virgibacillus dakarensis]|uniref:Protein GrpE n=1 Tax=Lentibacillus populi TaxID=1827502 RepID=A0A9W5X3V0_9BACI|nr:MULTISPECIES: nucleotide exchange factor GrpE [Bacillaceae]MBT2214514.1 nucleotide exchange factor GrpE [Virgibacillus dakarensis]MTW84119.1 nucleotide exchange factor GrpE [Virgibacillus dakarensis]GGB28981.1 protein GrpE [Lentibacillus populi]